MKKFLALAAVCLTLGACSTTRLNLNDKHVTIPTYEGTSHFIFWGLGQTKEFDPQEVCGSRGVSAVDTHKSFANGFLSTITYGIYYPETYSIYCNPQR
jgi:hypothetical protein